MQTRFSCPPFIHGLILQHHYNWGRHQKEHASTTMTSHNFNLNQQFRYGWNNVWTWYIHQIDAVPKKYEDIASKFLEKYRRNISLKLFTSDTLFTYENTFIWNKESITPAYSISENSRDHVLKNSHGTDNLIKPFLFWNNKYSVCIISDPKGLTYIAHFRHVPMLLHMIFSSPTTSSNICSWPCMP